VDDNILYIFRQLNISLVYKAIFIIFQPELAISRKPCRDIHRCKKVGYVSNVVGNILNKGSVTEILIDLCVVKNVNTTNSKFQ